jgi:hypothetical protein
MPSIRTYQQIPTEFAAMVFYEQLEKPFQLYMFFKSQSAGIFGKDSDIYNGARNVLGFKSHNTFNKHLRKLIALNWVGYDAVMQKFFVRSFDRLRAVYGFQKKQTAGLQMEKIQGMRAFLAAVIISGKIQNQKYYFEVGQRKEPATAVKRTGAALQVGVSSAPAQKWVPRRIVNDKASAHTNPRKDEKPAYYGYCNRTIAKILGCSKTKATDLKHEMEHRGFIKTIPHTEVILTLEKRNFRVRQDLYKAYPELSGKIIFRTALKRIKNSTRLKKVIEVVQQQYDEIIPLVKFARTAKKSSWLSQQKAA